MMDISEADVNHLFCCYKKASSFGQGLSLTELYEAAELPGEQKV